MTFRRRALRPRRSSKAALLVAAALALGGCPKEQAATQDSGEQQAQVPASRYKGATAAFVGGLCALKVYAYVVSDEGAAVVYEELSFREDGTFEARTSIRIGEEPFNCRESGSWAMDDDRADDRSTSALTMEVTETDCAGRSAPNSFRVRARIGDQDIELSHI